MIISMFTDNENNEWCDWWLHSTAISRTNKVHFCILILKESSAHDFKNVKMMIEVMFHKLIIALGYGGKKLINSECILAFNVFVFGQANYRM